MAKHRLPPPMVLSKFSKASRDLIREAEGYGWTFRMSARGHAIGRAPDGVTTMAVPAGLGTTSPRGLLNCRSELRRWVREQA